MYVMLSHHLQLDVACNFTFATNEILVVHVSCNLFLIANYSHKFATSQNQHWFGTCYQFSTSWVAKGVQRHFCMDLQRFEGHTTRYNSTPNWVEYIDTTCSSKMYLLNFNYVTIIKHDIDKLLVASFIKLIEKATWLSPIVVMCRKNKKLRICVDFKKLNATTNKDP
jgi:hypothetical protein